MQKWLEQLGYQRQGIQELYRPPTVIISPGAFYMGSDPTKDTLAQSQEFPQTLFLIDYAYAIARYPVTVAEYACAVHQGILAAPEPSPVVISIPGEIPLAWETQQHFPDHPIVNVSWFDAMEYAQWLSSVTGQCWRLPTEAEWEKAARGSDGRIFPWGDTWDSAKANTFDTHRGGIMPIGSFPAAVSPYGVEEMAGNVGEWCSTQFRPYPYQAEDGREDPSDDLREKFRVLRGGSWQMRYGAARAARRGPFTARIRADDVGFRLVLVL